MDDKIRSNENNRHIKKALDKKDRSEKSGHALRHDALMSEPVSWPEDVKFDISEFDDVQLDLTRPSRNDAPLREKRYEAKSPAQSRDESAQNAAGGERGDRPAKRKHHSLPDFMKNGTKPAEHKKASGGRRSNKKTGSDHLAYDKQRDDHYDELDTTSVSDARGISHEERRRRQRRRDALKLAAVFAAILLLIAALALLYRRSIVKTVNITGSEKYGSAQLISMSGIRLGKSALFYRDEALRKSLDDIHDIRTESIKKSLSGRIDITVSDVLPAAAILSANGNFVLISEDGYVLNITDEPQDDLILIRGMTGIGFSLNTFIDHVGVNARTVAAVRLIKAIRSSAIADKVIAIDLSSSVCVNLELENNYTIMLGSITNAHECIVTAATAYVRFLPVYPNGGTINVFHGSTVVDFTPPKQ